MALWGGRFAKDLDQAVATFSSSMDIDQKLWAVDIQGSIAHGRMLALQGVLSKADGELIEKGLLEISEEIKTKKWQPDMNAEDIHGEIEGRLFLKIGEAAKRMHTARSRNDQVATDTRLYLQAGVKELKSELRLLQKELLKQSEGHVQTVMPGMTHMQHAQPVSLAHHLMAYFWMFERDFARLSDSLPRVMSMPLGSAALAGTGFNIDRKQTAKTLGFAEVSPNSMDSVSDRDFVIEFLANASLVMMHLSRFCEELILWSTPEFGFVELGDEVTTGSSIMPQKKNPDVAELIRGRVGRVYGALMGALTMMKALPMAYNRDMQEDKVHLFSGLETVLTCTNLMTLMLQKADWKVERMKSALKGDFSNATDLADDLVLKGMSFREAHEVVGQVVRWCIDNKVLLEEISVAQLKSVCPKFDEVSRQKLDHVAVLRARTSQGGTSPDAVKAQLLRAQKVIS